MKNTFFKKIILFTFLLFISIGFLLFEKENILAQDNISDAIAVRIIPNPNHLSAQRWYKAQGFSGSPQALLVDGYKAVRDGRTVYVSATNISGNNFYTNIYLISYNQEADLQTLDIFGQIIKNWKFNTNITDTGTCSISSKICYENKDCPSSDYVCGNSGNAKNKCVLVEGKEINCLIDSECPAGLFCSSSKAKIVRDLDRLENLVVIEDKLVEYKKKNGNYPVLAAGTYLPHMVVSAWPSWQASFLSQIGVSGVLDPINKLGSCLSDNDPSNKNFNLDTCWNSLNNIFYNATSSYNNLNMPVNSRVIVYTSDPSGSKYNLCSNMETTVSDGYQISDGLLSGKNCMLNPFSDNYGFSSNSSTNQPPYLVDSYLVGYTNQEFDGFIRGADPEGQAISWGPIIFTGSPNFSTWDPSSTPQLLSTTDPNQKRIYAARAGNAGNYSFSINVADSLGASSTINGALEIKSPEEVQIIGGDIFHNLSVFPNFDYSFDIKHPSISTFKVCFSGDHNINCDNFSLCSPKTFSSSMGVECGHITNNNKTLNFCLDKNLGNHYVLNVKQATTALSVGVYSFCVEAGSSLPSGQSSFTRKQVNIQVSADPPQVNFNNCLKSVNLGDDYNCQISVVNPMENEYVVFSTTTTPLPRGLSLVKENDKYYIKGSILDQPGSFPIVIKADNQTFGTSATSSFNLFINSNCEDSLVQYDGGPWNSSGSVRNHSGFYKTVLIGNQCWLKDNLNIGTQVLATSTGATASSTNGIIEKYCYNNDSLYCDVYGALYSWGEASNNSTSTANQGICPPGWRLAADSDWYFLENYLKNNSSTCSSARVMNNIPNADCEDAGARMKSSGDSGFDALFINKFSVSGLFATPLDAFSLFWSSSFYELLDSNNKQNLLIMRKIKKTESGIYRDTSAPMTDAYSVRCVKGQKNCSNNTDCGTGMTCLDNICVVPAPLTGGSSSSGGSDGGSGGSSSSDGESGEHVLTPN